MVVTAHRYLSPELRSYTFDKYDLRYAWKEYILNNWIVRIEKHFILDNSFL